MGIFSKLFGKAAETSPVSARSAARWKTDDGWLMIQSIPNFYGKTRSSLNGRWTVAHCERHLTAPDGVEGGGSVVLLDNVAGRIVKHILDLERPFDSVVSDEGVFAVHDACLGEGPRAQVLVYSTNGELLFSRGYLANIGSLGISTCGRYVALQTLNSDRDGNLFEVLDLRNSRVQFSVVPTTGFADDYRFEVGAEGLKRVFVVHKKLGAFAYDSAGQFLEAAQLSEALLSKGDFSQKLWALRDLLSETSSFEVAHRVLKVADEVLSSEIPPHLQSWAALAHRLKGEAYERLSEPVSAIASYESALSIDPKAGVRRALGRLRRVTQGRTKDFR